MSTPRSSSATIYWLSLIGFFGIMSTTMSKNPVLPLFAHALGASDSLLGVIAAISPLAGILFSFPVGALADQFGRKRMLLISALVFALAPLFYLLITAPVYLIPVRFFHGLATAILGPIASALIAETYRENKGSRLGAYSSVTLVGRTLAPLLGGFILTLSPALTSITAYRMVYVAAFLLGLVVFVCSLMIHEDTPTTSNAHKTLAALLASFRAFSRNPLLVATSQVEMATYFCFGILETYLPLHLHAQHVSAGQIGFIFALQTLSIALTKPLFGKIADRFDTRWQISLGLLSLLVSMALLPLCSGMWAWTGLSLLFGLGMSFGTVATMTYTADIASREQLGAALGALSSVMDIGHSSGPLLAGFIITAWSLSVGFGFGALVCLASLLWFVLAAFRKSTIVRT